VDWQDQSLVAVTATGNEHWRVEVGHRRSIAGFDNAEVADYTGDSVADLFNAEINEMGSEEVIVRDGHDGSLVRRLAVGPMLSLGAEAVTTGAYLQGHAIFDVNGDHVPDVLSALHPQWFLALDVSSVTLHTLWIDRGTTSSIVNGQAMIAPMAADGSPRVLRVNSQNAFGPYVRFALNGAIEAQVPPVNVAPGQDYVDQNNAAFITHAGTPTRFDFVTAGMAGAATGLVVRYDGLSLTPTWQVYLSNGMLSMTPPAHAAALHDPIVVDVDGDHADEVLVGSDDGYLYALHGDGTLLFAFNLQSPVVHVVAANLDGDPPLEILCARSDGSLVAIDQMGSYTWSPVPTPDVGPEPMPDGGSISDASSDAFDSGHGDSGTGPTGTHNGSCGCRTVGSSRAGPFAALVALALALASLRRRARKDPE
jgi:MYXO-CTERM domain-containing protein